jgi:triacylglycerol lipase
MHEHWYHWPLLALAIGLAAAAVFVAGTYLSAVLLTRGKFGWPGLGYFVEETLWVVITQALLPSGWLPAQVRTPLLARGPSPVADAPASASAGARPIVLVHGYTQNRTNFLWLSRWLRRRGHGPFFGFNYQSFGPVEESARALDAFVEEVVRATGGGPVDLVCHSLGGLVARTYVDLHGGHRRVARVVTLGTPHRGLDHASGVVGASVRDMQPRTGFIAKLDGAPLPATVSYLSIYSSHDNIVFPARVSSLGVRGSDIMVERQGHFGILFSEEVAAHVHRALSAEPPGRTG